MSKGQLAFIDVKGGMNAADLPNKITTSQVARTVNCELDRGIPTTRRGVRVVPLSGSGSQFIRENNFQGSIFFNPAKGQGGIILADSNSQIASVFAGRKYVVKVGGRNERAVGVVMDITNGLVSNPRLHLAWISAWENLLVIGDGQGSTFIWDSKNPATVSPGYNTTEKDQSQIPNGGTVMCYAHARGIMVVNSRYILASDSLHETNNSSSENLRFFTDQTYWATGQYFIPPSSMGNITAGAILPIRDTQHGQGETIFHCEDGIFSIDFNVYPRTAWANTAMVKHALLQAGAMGPYALALVDGDQYFRSRKGLQTLRSAAAPSVLEGNPEQALSSPVDLWLRGDYRRWLRFASVCVWGERKRVLLTVNPIVQGRFRWHRGLIVRNTDPADSEDNTKAVWEGLWTLPPQMSGIIQLVNGLFDQEERQFAWVRGDDRKNRLVEFSRTATEDVLEDGTRRPIRCQLVTREVDGGQWFQSREFTSGRLFLRNILGKVRFGVWFRPSASVTWIKWTAGEVENPEMLPGSLEGGMPRTLAIPLGELPKEVDCETDRKPNESRSVQFLIRWEGHCAVEGIRISHGEKDLDDDLKVIAKVTIIPQSGGDYDDFEYSATDANLWATSETSVTL